MKTKIDKWSVLFILYGLWHYLIIHELTESQASLFLRVTSAIGIVALDVYLFFAEHRRGEQKKEFANLKYNYQQKIEAYKLIEESVEYHIQVIKRQDETISNYQEKLNDALTENKKLHREIECLRGAGNQSANE